MLGKFIAVSLLLVLAISCKKEDVTDYGPIDEKIITDYLAAHDITNAHSTASGLYYVIQKPGGTNHPTIKSSVSVNYKGYLTNGTIFDSSYKWGKPLDLVLTSMIVGWQEGIPLVGVGGKMQLFVPSALAYGTTGKAPVPPNAVIIFEIELVDFY